MKVLITIAFAEVTRRVMGVAVRIGASRPVRLWLLLVQHVADEQVRLPRTMHDPPGLRRGLDSTVRVREPAAGPERFEPFEQDARLGRFEQREEGGVILGGQAGELGDDRAMDGGHPGPRGEREQHGSVGESHDGFGVREQESGIDLARDAQKSVATAGHEDGARGRIAQGLDQTG